MKILFLISFIILVAYALLLIYYLRGWLKLKTNRSGNFQKTSLDVIIPFRNEEENIARLIECLMALDCRGHQIKFILINDHSVDNSQELAQKLCNTDNRFSILELPDNIEGKKAALRFALEHARGEVVVFGDADCVYPVNWLKEMTKCMHREKADMVLAPVMFEGSGGFLSKFCEFELTGLMMVTAAAVFYNKPVMANGANMLVKRQSINEKVDFFKQNITSGDDAFLLLSMKKDKNKKISFLKSLETTAITKTPHGFNEFMAQRKRWVSKNRGISDNHVLRDAYVVFFINSVLLINFVVSFFGNNAIYSFLILYIIKSLIDVLFIFNGLIFFKKSTLIKYIFVFQFFNFLYVPLVAIFGTIGPFTWKKRLYRQ